MSEVDEYINRLQREVDRICAVTPEQMSGYLDRIEKACALHGIEVANRPLREIKAELRAKGVVL